MMKFTKQVITIKVYAGKENVLAHMLGDWAIHRIDLGSSWHVTHAPTGLAIGSAGIFSRLKDAKRFVERLKEIGLPDFGNAFGKDTSMSMPWEQRQRIRRNLESLHQEILK